MKKIIFIILLSIGFYPMFKNGQFLIYCSNISLAQTQASENLPDSLYDDPCAGLAEDFNTSMTNCVEQSGLLVTDNTGDTKYISMDDIGNNGTTSGWAGISFDSSGDPYINYGGEDYPIESFVHTHPNSSNGPSPTDWASMDFLNSKGGNVDGMVVSGDGMVRPYSSDGTNHNSGTPQSLTDYTNENCYLDKPDKERVIDNILCNISKLTIINMVSKLS